MINVAAAHLCCRFLPAAVFKRGRAEQENA